MMLEVSIYYLLKGYSFKGYDFNPKIAGTSCIVCFFVERRTFSLAFDLHFGPFKVDFGQKLYFVQKMKKSWTSQLETKSNCSNLF